MPAASPSRPYVIRPSPVHGRGVFAIRSIRKGTRIVGYCGAPSTRKVANRRPLTDPDDSCHTLMFELSDGTVIDASVHGNAARWINHCFDPNCKAIETDDGRVFIVAKRSIHDGDELRYDYRLGFEGRVSRRDREAMACRCGARRCRGTMLRQSPRQPKKPASAG